MTGTGTGAEPLSPTGPGIERPRFHNVWEDLTFVHWPVDVAAVAAALPHGLEPDLHDGRAWVSLVPFAMSGVRPHGLPSVPWLSRFAETNVRTYVVDRDGRRGVWFSSLEAARLPIVAVARRVMRFPYVWSKMRVERHDDRVTYVTTRRRWPRGPATSRVTVEVGDGERTADDGLDLFLTARWYAHTAHRGRIRRAPVTHEPWRLRPARLLELDDELVAAAGFAVGGTEPVVAFADRIHATFGPVQRLGP